VPVRPPRPSPTPLPERSDPEFPRSPSGRRTIHRYNPVAPDGHDAVIRAVRRGKLGLVFVGLTCPSVTNQQGSHFECERPSNPDST